MYTKWLYVVSRKIKIQKNIKYERNFLYGPVIIINNINPNSEFFINIVEFAAARAQTLGILGG